MEGNNKKCVDGDSGIVDKENLAAPRQKVYVFYLRNCAFGPENAYTYILVSSTYTFHKALFEPMISPLRFPAINCTAGVCYTVQYCIYVRSGRRGGYRVSILRARTDTVRIRNIACPRAKPSCKLPVLCATRLDLTTSYGRLLV